MEISAKQLIPIYYRIFDELYNEIRDGVYQEGDRFPSESELCAKYKVSRGTVREALKMLFRQGFLLRERGRGTFVTETKIEQDAHKLMGFTELMRMNEKVAKAKILEITIKYPGNRIQKLLELEENNQIVKIQRLRYGDDEPLIIERSYFVYKIFKPFLSYDLENESIYELMYRESDFRLGIAQQSIEAVIAGPEESKLFVIDPGSPLLLIKRLIRLEDNTLFQYSEDMYRSDKLKFTINTLPYDESHKNFRASLELKTNVT